MDGKKNPTSVMAWTGQLWSGFFFSVVSKRYKKSWSKGTVTDPWERLVSRHLDSSRQNFIRMKVERLCVVIMDTHMCHDGELTYTALAAWNPVKTCKLNMTNTIITNKHVFAWKSFGLTFLSQLLQVYKFRLFCFTSFFLFHNFEY